MVTIDSPHCYIKEQGKVMDEKYETMLGEKKNRSSIISQRLSQRNKSITVIRRKCGGKHLGREREGNWDGGGIQRMSKAVRGW